MMKMNCIIDDLRGDIKNVKINNWKKVIKDREEWMKIVEVAKTHKWKKNEVKDDRQWMRIWNGIEEGRIENWRMFVRWLKFGEMGREDLEKNSKNPDIAQNSVVLL